MNIWAIISLLSSILVFILGNIVFSLNKKNLVNKISAILCIILSWWGFTEFMYRQAESDKVAYLWVKLSSFWVLSLPILLHLVLIIIEKQEWLNKNKIVLFTIYFLGIFFVLVNIFTELIVTYPIKTYWGYTYTVPKKLWMFTIETIWAIIMGFSIIYFNLVYYVKSIDIKKKKQTKFFLLGISFTIILGLITEGILPAINIRIPEMTTLGMVFLAIFIGYAIWKYELFTVNPAVAATNIISTMGDSLILTNPQLIILNVNKALLKLLEYKENELVGKHIKMIFDDFNEDEFEKITKKVLSLEKLNIEKKFVTKKEEKIPVSLSVSNIKDRSNEVVGFVFLAHDLREIKRLQTRLIQSEKLSAVGQLAGGVAHEINNPLGVILGFAQLIAKDVKEGDPLYVPLKSIEREAIRCKKLIDDLLSFAVLGRIWKENADINEIIDKTLSLLDFHAKTSKVNIIKNFAPNLPKIKVNITRIQQVIVNLCNNAIDAIVEKGVDVGEIKITTGLVKEGDKEYIEILVADTGIGMSEEVKRHIFEPFFTTKDVGKGTGLGLSLVYETIQQHDGVIEVESELGKGTTFKIKLPIYESKDTSS